MSKTEFLDPIEIEIKRRLGVLGTNDIQNEIELWEGMVEKLSANEILEDANKFLQDLTFKHPGLTKEQYCAHCYRVSTLALRFSDKNCQIIGVIGLLHNILEVSDVSVGKIQQKFGSEISNALAILKIERDLQWDKNYLEKYYNDIKFYSEYLSKVKVIDKLDNLFVLGLNPSDEVRRVYLQEIENYIVPMASKIEIDLADYFRKLISYNNRVGHFTKENFLNEEE